VADTGRSPKLLAALIFASIFLQPSIVRAVLVEQDLYAPGDGLVSRDVSHGIDWLDLPLTVGLSIDDVSNGAGGWTSQGWAIATYSDVCGLAVDVMGPSVICPTEYSSASIYYDDRALDSIHLLGITDEFGDGHIGSSGFFDDGDLSDGEAVLGSYFFLVNLNGVDQSQFNLTENQGPSIYTRWSNVGVFLVRPIPEPGTGALLSIGLLALRSRRDRSVSSAAGQAA
jgi:PEP-CTERM motif